MEVGKIYQSGHHTCECLRVLSDKRTVMYWQDEHTKNDIVMFFSEADQKLYKEYKEPKKVYCSVWKSQVGDLDFLLYSGEFGEYKRMQERYKQLSYVMYKEWELEYTE